MYKTWYLPLVQISEGINDLLYSFSQQLLLRDKGDAGCDDVGDGDGDGGAGGGDGGAGGGGDDGGDGADGGGSGCRQPPLFQELSENSPF